MRAFMEDAQDGRRTLMQLKEAQAGECGRSESLCELR